VTHAKATLAAYILYVLARLKISAYRYGESQEEEDVHTLDCEGQHG